MGKADPEGLPALAQVCDQLCFLQARGSRAVLQLYPENSEQVQPISQPGRATGREIIYCLGLTVLFLISSVPLPCLPLVKLFKSPKM